eukprot:9439263-Pyramimonas_sp.AAC.1
MFEANLHRLQSLSNIPGPARAHAPCSAGPRGEGTKGTIAPQTTSWNTSYSIAASVGRRRLAGGGASTAKAR